MYIAIEGIDGCGKTTQAALLAKRCNAWPIKLNDPKSLTGAVVRTVLAGDTVLEPRAMSLLHMANRAEVSHAVLQQRPQMVVTDRCYLANVALQAVNFLGDQDINGVVDTLALTTWYNWLARTEFNAMCNLMPDVVFWIDVDPEVAGSRERGRAADQFEKDVERQKWSHFAYKFMHENNYHGVVRIDGNGTVEEVAERIWTELTKYPAFELYHSPEATLSPDELSDTYQVAYFINADTLTPEDLMQLMDDHIMGVHTRNGTIQLIGGNNLSAGEIETLFEDYFDLSVEDRADEIEYLNEVLVWNIEKSRLPDYLHNISTDVVVKELGNDTASGRTETISPV